MTLFLTVHNGIVPEPFGETLYRSSAWRAVPENNGEMCYCAHNAICNFQKLRRNSSWWTVEGIFTGCSMVDSVLRSSLICWYNINCLNELRMMFSLNGIAVPKNITVLDAAIPSRYSSNTLE